MPHYCGKDRVSDPDADLAEDWIASQGGPNPTDNPASYNEDTSWRFVAAWAP